MSISGWRDKQIVVYTMEYEFIHKKEWNADIGYSIDELENIMLSGKKNTHESPSIVWLHLYKMSQTGKSIKTERRLVVAMR